MKAVNLCRGPERTYRLADVNQFVQVARLSQYECLKCQKRDFVVYTSSDWQPVQICEYRRNVVSFARSGDYTSKAVLETLKLSNVGL